MDDVLAQQAATSVWIERLKLHCFRNYQTLDMHLDQRSVVLTGENGAGKTNLLEAISFLSPGRGLRRSAYDRVTKVHEEREDLSSEHVLRQNLWAVHVAMHGAYGPVEIGTGLQRGAKGREVQRKVHINKAPVRRMENLLDHARVLWLTPAMDGLFTGAASERRRFLDRFVLAIDPLHGRRMVDFEKAMRSRNKLLEDFNADVSWLDGLERQMAQTAVAIAFARAELIALLRNIIEENKQGQMRVFPHADIALEGFLENLLTEGAAADLEDQYKAHLTRHRARDRAAGRTLDGPHRSNFVVVHGVKKIEAALCSTGEQKALLTGLVLAHARLVRNISGQIPVLLLDEITAHFDETRRAGLFDMINHLGCQAWMSGTDRQMFSALGEGAQFFTVNAGQISQHQ